MPSAVLAVQRHALGNRRLVGHVAAQFLAVTAEWAIFIGVLVQALDRSGTAAVGLASVAVLSPYLICPPMVAAVSQRWSARHVRVGGMVLQTGGFLVAGVTAAGSAPLALTVAGAAIGTAGVTALRPSGAALLVSLARSARELTVGNLWTGYADGIAGLVGPVSAAVLLSIGGAPAVILGAAVSSLAATLGSLACLPRRGTRAPTHPPAHVWSQVRTDLADVGRQPGLAAVVAVAGLQFVALGALDVLTVVIAERDLGLGDSGPGVLQAVLGVGALIGGAIVTFTLDRRRPSSIIVAGLAGVSIGAGALAVDLRATTAVMALLLIGLARTSAQLSADVMLHRAAPAEQLPAVFSVVGITSGVGLILGSLLAQAVLATAGAQAAFAALGAAFVLLLGLTPALRRADASASVPVVSMSALRELAVFSPLPRAALESLARSADELHVGPGAPVVRQGDPGDCYYAIVDGNADVEIDDRPVRTLGQGEGFGEIALVTDAPRAATVRARGPLHLLVIARADFLGAVTGHAAVREAVEDAIEDVTGRRDR